MTAQPITHVGPFNTQVAGWMFTCAVLMLSTALLGLALLAAFSIVAGSMTCSIENQTALSLAAVFGTGAGFLIATAFDAPLARAATGLVAAVIAGAAGFVLTQLIYAPHCGVIPMLRVLLRT